VDQRCLGRKRACPSTWISFITAGALVRERLATISVSGSPPAAASMARLWLVAEAENSHLQVLVIGASSGGTV
jgi:hypothetical protein